ncbi:MULTISPECIES: heavy metal-binding domain-containing protein [Rhodomicrobium]|uniref:YbjQ family protein n=1 Tax=Rhodomicrobium TaxID=1068 RepID=UPI000B4B83C4|nr:MULTISPECIES: heavy metal-binding domain-containing protein [Rhodomicrobium]
MALYTVDRISDRKVREGEMLWVSAVNAANILRDVREMITNTFGGKMRRYERLMELTLQRALADLEAKAKDKGYDGCLAVRISHPRIADGACEIFVYGTAFHFVAEESH